MPLYYQRIQPAASHGFSQCKKMKHNSSVTEDHINLVQLCI